MIELIDRRSVGTPSTICGNESVVTVIWAVWGSTSIFARVMIVPRLNGPAITGVTIDRPNGAPLYGPVKKIGASGSPGWGITNGYEPGPEVTTAWPMCEAAEHAPCAACGSGQRGTLEIMPAN